MELFFYIFAFLLITSTIGVIGSKNAVYSVLWLIFAFCNSAGLFVLLGAEFLAFTLVIVYVGAVAVLFLFVVMMLDIDIAIIKSGIARNWPLVLFFLVIFTADLFAIMFLAFAKHNAGLSSINIDLGNIYNIGSVLYTKYMLPFQLVGLILFIAMIGCIALTIRHLHNVKRQDKSAQLSRNKDNGMEIVKVKVAAAMKDIKYD